MMTLTFQLPAIWRDAHTPGVFYLQRGASCRQFARAGGLLAFGAEVELPPDAVMLAELPPFVVEVHEVWADGARVPA